MRILIALIFLVAGAAMASHGMGRCDGSGHSLGIIEIGTGEPTGTFYIDDRNYLLGNGIWTYAETNGIYPYSSWAHENLQRGGDSLGGVHRDICTDVGDYAPDTLIY